jgi:hypothetical protein
MLQIEDSMKPHRALFVLAAVSVLPIAIVHCGGDDGVTGGSSGVDASAEASPTGTSTNGVDGSTQTGKDSGGGNGMDAGNSNGTDSGANDTDGGVDAGKDAAGYCDLGVVTGDSTGGQLRRFFADGGALPAGHYRLTYVGGCMKYGPGQDWTVHAYAPAEGGAGPAYATWFTAESDGGSSAYYQLALPGTWIYGPGAVTYDASATDTQQFDDCVALNKMMSIPNEFDYDAGEQIGIQLNDAPLGDNTAGIDGGDPTWHLEVYSQTGDCPK